MNLSNVKYHALIGLLVLVTISAYGQDQELQNPKRHFVTALEEAENAADLGMIQSVFSEDAVLYTTEDVILNNDNLDKNQKAYEELIELSPILLPISDRSAVS